MSPSDLTRGPSGGGDGGCGAADAPAAPVVAKAAAAPAAPAPAHRPPREGLKADAVRRRPGFISHLQGQLQALERRASLLSARNRLLRAGERARRDAAQQLALLARVHGLARAAEGAVAALAVAAGDRDGGGWGAGGGDARRRAAGAGPARGSAADWDGDGRETAAAAGSRTPERSAPDWWAPRDFPLEPGGGAGGGGGGWGGSGPRALGSGAAGAAGGAAGASAEVAPRGGGSPPACEPMVGEELPQEPPLPPWGSAERSGAATLSASPGSRGPRGAPPPAARPPSQTGGGGGGDKEEEEEQGGYDPRPPYRSALCAWGGRVEGALRTLLSVSAPPPRVAFSVPADAAAVAVAAAAAAAASASYLNHTHYASNGSDDNNDGRRPGAAARQAGALASRALGCFAEDGSSSGRGGVAGGSDDDDGRPLCTSDDDDDDDDGGSSGEDSGDDGGRRMFRASMLGLFLESGEDGDEAGQLDPQQGQQGQQQQPQQQPQPQAPQPAGPADVLARAARETARRAGEARRMGTRDYAQANVLFCGRMSLLLRRLRSDRAALRRHEAEAQAASERRGAAGPGGGGGGGGASDDDDDAACAAAAAAARSAASVRDGERAVRRTALDFMALLSAVAHHNPRLRAELVAWHLERGPDWEAAADAASAAAVAERAAAGARLSRAQSRSVAAAYDLFKGNASVAVAGWVAAALTLARAADPEGPHEQQQQQQQQQQRRQQEKGGGADADASGADADADAGPDAGRRCRAPLPPPARPDLGPALAELARCLALYRAAGDHLATGVVAELTPPQFAAAVIESYPWPMRAPCFAGAVARACRRREAVAAPRARERPRHPLPPQQQ